MAEESMKDFEKEINESFKTAKKVENEDGGKWERFAELIETKEEFDVKIIEAVKGGCIAYLEDTRGFIPASQLSIAYVKDLSEFQGQHIKVRVITADPEKKRLVLSHRVIEQDEKDKEKAEKLAAIKKDDVVEGSVETIQSYGAFVNLGGVTGLLHISQIPRKNGKKLETPADVLAVGDKVTVKVTDIRDGKLSLSMRALEERSERPERADRPERRGGNRKSSYLEETDGFEYVEKTQAVTSLGDLLKGIKLD